MKLKVKEFFSRSLVIPHPPKKTIHHWEWAGSMWIIAKALGRPGGPEEWATSAWPRSLPSIPAIPNKQEHGSVLEAWRTTNKSVREKKNSLYSVQAFSPGALASGKSGHAVRDIRHFPFPCPGAAWDHVHLGTCVFSLLHHASRCWSLPMWANKKKRRGRKKKRRAGIALPSLWFHLRVQSCPGLRRDNPNRVNLARDALALASQLILALQAFAQLRATLAPRPTG